MGTALLVSGTNKLLVSAGVALLVDNVVTEVDVGPASPALGVSVAATLTRLRSLSAAMSLGLSEAAAFSFTKTLTATNSLGVSMAAALIREANIAILNAGLGVTMAATLTRELDEATPESLGYNMVVVLTLQSKKQPVVIVFT